MPNPEDKKPRKTAPKMRANPNTIAQVAREEAFVEPVAPKKKDEDVVNRIEENFISAGWSKTKLSDVLKSILFKWRFILIGVGVILAFLLVSHITTCSSQNKITKLEQKAADSINAGRQILVGIDSMRQEIKAVGRGVQQGLLNDQLTNDQLNTVLSNQEQQRKENKRQTDEIARKLLDKSIPASERDSIEYDLIHAIYEANKNRD